MYEELLKYLDYYGSDEGCGDCPSPFSKQIGYMTNLMGQSAQAIRDLQSKFSKKIDLDSTPEEFCKAMGATECKNGTEYIEMFCMGYEDDVFVLNIENKIDLMLVRMYMENFSGKRYGEAMKDEYIGKRIVVNFWDESCNVVGTREEMELKFKSYLDRLFGTENENG